MTTESETHVARAVTDGDTILAAEDVAMPFERMTFDLQPILKSELLELRPLRAEDFHDLYAVAADPFIWEQHPIKERYKEEVFREFFHEALESGGALLVIDSKDGQVIGSSRFHGYDEERSEIEIGSTFLARSHWGGVYNREVKQLMLSHAFRFVESVIFLVAEFRIVDLITQHYVGADEKLSGMMLSVAHLQQKYQNNRAENSHQPTRSRERVMRRFKSSGHARRFLSAFGIITSPFRVGRHLYRASGYREVMKSRFAVWEEAICVGVDS